MKKGIGDKVLSWFVVPEDEEPALPEDDVRPAREVPEPPTKPLAALASTVEAQDFGEVYVRAGVAQDGRERLARVMTLLATLPAEATLDVKRAIVSASLQAFGVPLSQVVASCDEALTALDAHAVQAQSRTEQVLVEARTRIDRLNAEIADLRKLMDREAAVHEESHRRLNDERARIRETRDFFQVPPR